MNIRPDFNQSLWVSGNKIRHNIFIRFSGDRADKNPFVFVAGVTIRQCKGIVLAPIKVRRTIHAVLFVLSSSWIKRPNVQFE